MISLYSRYQLHYITYLLLLQVPIFFFHFDFIYFILSKDFINNPSKNIVVINSWKNAGKSGSITFFNRPMYNAYKYWSTVLDIFNILSRKESPTTVTRASPCIGTRNSCTKNTVIIEKPRQGKLNLLIFIFKCFDVVNPVT